MLDALKRLLDGVVSFFQGRGGATAEERRRLIRVRCDYQVQCQVGETRLPARVVDIGLNGMRLLLEQRVKSPASMQVHHPSSVLGFDSEEVVCHVRWCRKRRKGDGYEVGLQYADTEGNVRHSWVKYLLKELGFDERSIFTRRKSIRAQASLPAQIVDGAGGRLQGIVVNLGAGGALFEGPEIGAEGDNVVLHLGPAAPPPSSSPSLTFKALELPATVVESRDSYTSLRFGQLDHSQVRQLGEYVLYLLKEQSS